MWCETLEKKLNFNLCVTLSLLNKVLSFFDVDTDDMMCSLVLVYINK